MAGVFNRPDVLEVSLKKKKCFSITSRHIGALVCVLTCASSGAAAQRQRRHQRALPRQDIRGAHESDGRLRPQHQNQTAFVFIIALPPHPQPLTPSWVVALSDCPPLLSPATLDIARSRVTAAGACDAVLRVPLEFGMGYVWPPLPLASLCVRTSFPFHQQPPPSPSQASAAYYWNPVLI
jgi:hypothetical protein